MLTSPVPLSNRFQSLAEHDVIRKSPQKLSQGLKNKARSPLEEENLKKYKTSESLNIYDEQNAIVSNVLGQAYSVLNPIGENPIVLDGTCPNDTGGPLYDRDCAGRSNKARETHDSSKSQASGTLNNQSDPLDCNTSRDKGSNGTSSARVS